MSKILPEKPKKIDEMEFAAFLRRVPIKEFSNDYIPPAVTVPNKITRWHAKNATGDPNKQVFHIFGHLSRKRYNFISQLDWKGLMAPLCLVSPTDPAHERYVNHHEIRKPEEIAGEDLVRELARNLVESYERSEYARLNPDCEPFHRFVAMNFMQRPVPFLTRPGWRGLWVHSIYRTNDDMPVEPQNREFRIFKTVDEISGEQAIRLAARRYLAEFDRVITATTNPSRRRKPYMVKLGPRRQSALKDIKSYLTATTKMPVRDPDVLRWVLDNAWIHLLPDDFKTAPQDERESLWGEGEIQKPVRQDSASNPAQNASESDA